MNSIVETEKIEEKIIDPSTNEDINIEDIIEGFDISSYGSMKWDHKKQKWINARF